MRVRIKKIIAALISILILSSIFTRVSALDDGEGEINERIAVERMARSFENFEESIDLSDLNIPVSSLSKLFSHATKNSPYLFYVDKRLTYTYRKDTVVNVIPKYNMTEDEAREAIDFCKLEVSKLAAVASMGESEIQRLILAHDLICSRYQYDLTLEGNNIYKFIKEGKGTCQGYTWTYMAVLRELGIECEYVASDSINHIWLRVKIDGEWYNSDVTWDDPVGNEAGISSARRLHLLFSDDKADKDGYVDGYSASQNKCTSKKYDGEELSSALSPSHKQGDVDHDGAVDLLDLVLIRQNRIACPICADVDCDLLLTEGDAELVRERLLTNRLE